MEGNVKSFRVLNISKNGKELDLNNVLDYNTTKLILKTLNLTLSYPTDLKGGGAKVET